MKVIKPRKWKTPYLNDTYLKNPLLSFLSFNKLKKILNLVPFGKENVLDSGCGQGYFLLSLNKYYKNVIGLDKNFIIGEENKQALSESYYWKKEYYGKSLLDVAREMLDLELGSNKIKLIEKDASDTKLGDGSMDVVFLLDVMEHEKNVSKLLKENYRILKKNGYFVYSVPNSIGFGAFLRVIGARLVGLREYSELNQDHKFFNWKKNLEDVKKFFKIEKVIKYPFILSTSIIVKARK